MAKIEGTQNIPSEWKMYYDGAATPAMPNSIVRKRYPWRLPKMQEGGYGVSEAQKKQRERVKKIVEKFKKLSPAERARWYAARPPWHSLLWYYNYFIMSGLLGNAVVGKGGGGVIKSIKHYTFYLASGENVKATIDIDTIDPNKAVVFFYGAGAYELYEGAVVAVYPYLVSLNSSQLVAGAPMYMNVGAYCSVSVIEYI
jgi:hypothetical protein